MQNPNEMLLTNQTNPYSLPPPFKSILPLLDHNDDSCVGFEVLNSVDGEKRGGERKSWVVGKLALLAGNVRHPNLPTYSLKDIGT